ncbi:MAG: hypothetical protein KDJ97_38510, partial [Anaerolineae bacterium]|nr:hypothetical protein [Anaerolineae bacterium]
MARLRAKEKILFYPTPLSVVEVIATNVATAGGRLFDPCCGDGRPAHLLGQRLGLTTYGVELHPDRAAQAAQRLDHCLTGAREFLVTEPRFNLIFSNPPYDQELGGGRMEVTHIQLDLELLRPGGLGIWVIPEPVLDVQLCQLLVTHLEQVALRRFPQPEYDRFKQVVVFGRKRPSPAVNTYTLASGLDRRCRDGLPTLQAGEFAYAYDGQVAPLTCFEMGFPDSSTILAEVETVGLHTEASWHTLLGGRSLGFGDFQPVLRLNAGHTAMAIAAGIVNGTEVTIDGRRHLIKGSTRKRVKASSDTNSTTDGTETTLREREVLVQTITALNLDTGHLTEYNSLDDQDGFSRFLLNHQHALVDSIEANFPPLFEPERDMPVWLPQLARVRPPGQLAGKLVAEGLLPAQQVRAAALAARLQTAKGVILIGEMGVGKTATAQAITALIGKGNWKLVVVAPAQVCEKWQREARTVLRDFGVSVHLIGRKRRQPDGRGQVRQVSKPVLDVIRAMAEPKPSVLVISYQLAKSGARWEHAATRQRKPLTLRVEVEETLSSYPYRQRVEREVTRVKTVYCCPDCGQTLTLDGQPVTDLAELGQRQHRCDECGAALWQQIPFKYGGRVALADFLNRRYSGRYNLILDEAHHTKGADTDVGYASADLVAGANKVIAMTGTLYSGKASSIFYLMYRLLPQFRQLYGYDEVQRFIEHHGLQEIITKVKKFDRYHSTYGYQRENVRVREIPGVSPGMVTMLLGHTAFLKLADVGLALPPYTEERLPVPLDDRLLEGLADLDRLHETAVKLAQEGRPGLLSTWLFASLGWVDCPVDETLAVKDDQGQVVETFSVSGVLTQAAELFDEPLAKDQVLLEVIRSELAQERGVGIFFSQ